jgi:hypothetical protein
MGCIASTQKAAALIMAFERSSQVFSGYADNKPSTAARSGMCRMVVW